MKYTNITRYKKFVYYMYKSMIIVIIRSTFYLKTVTEKEGGGVKA
jgi:hypothetical protein